MEQIIKRPKSALHDHLRIYRDRPLVRRIIERHGVKIWVDGAQDQGAAFFFSLPDSP